MNRHFPSLARGLGGAVIAISLGACPVPPVARPYPPPQLASVAAQLRARATQVPALATEAKVDYLAGHGDRVKLTMDFLTAAPDRVRIDALAPIGESTIASLATDGKRLEVLDTRENRFYAGPATACAVSRLLRVALAPADLVLALGGGAPLLGEPTQIVWDPNDGGREVLTAVAPDGTREEIRLAPVEKGRDWDVAAVTVTAKDGTLLYRLTHEGFAPDGPSGVRFPSESHIEEPSQSADVIIRYRSRELAPPTPDKAFTLLAPPGIPVEPLDCDGR